MTRKRVESRLFKAVAKAAISMEYARRYRKLSKLAKEDGKKDKSRRLQKQSEKDLGRAKDMITWIAETLDIPADIITEYAGSVGLAESVAHFWLRHQLDSPT